MSPLPRPHRFAAWFSTCSPPYAVSVLSGAALSVAAVCYPLAERIDARLGKWITLPPFDVHRWHFVVLAIVISPVLETLFYQFLVFKLAERSKWLREKAGLIVVLSAVIFGGQHFYSAGAVFISTLVGLVFATGFLLSGRAWRAFWVVTAAHCAVNSVALAVKW